MARRSLYDVLLVDENATLDEIKVAFKRRALQVHPDKGGSKEEFHLVYQALETLGDAALRQKYDQSLATGTKKTGAATHPKSKKRKREGKTAHPATHPKAKMQAKPKQKMPGKGSTTSAGKAPSKAGPTRATRATTTATPAAEPQSKQTKLLIKIRNLLKQLPREARNDVITNQLSQKQRVILETWMVNNAHPSAGTQGHSETSLAKALPPSAGSFEIEISSREASHSLADSSHGSRLAALPETDSREAMAKSTEGTRKSKKRVRSSCDVLCEEPQRAMTSSKMQALDVRSLANEAAETHAPPNLRCMKETNLEMDVTQSEGSYALAVPNSRRARGPDISDMAMAREKGPDKVKTQKKKKAFNVKARSSSGCIHKAGSRSSLYVTRIRFDSIEMNTRKSCDLKTALDHLLILTSVKQKMRNHIGVGSFVEQLQAAMVSSAAEHGRNLADLKISFLVLQSAGCFIGSGLRSPSVRSLELFGRIRSVFEPFRQYAKNVGKQNVYWQFSPIHLQDAWEQFQSAVAQAWEIAGVDSTAILQKICSLYEAQAPFRSASLQRWEQQHMARQDKNRHRPWRLREKTCTGHLVRWERRQMAMQDKNKHRPRRLRDRNPTGRLERWERRQMAMQDKNRHRPWCLRERNPAARLECWERRQMAKQDKNKHRPKTLQERNPPTGRLECWERRQMALEDKNKHRPKKLRQNVCHSESGLLRQLSALRKLIARWSNMLKRESKLLEKERRSVIRQRKARQKKGQEDRRRVEVLNEKRRREEERLRRERLRKRMRSDLTMDDILEQKDV